jgi:hypothetical protein
VIGELVRDQSLSTGIVGIGCVSWAIRHARFKCHMNGLEQMRDDFFPILPRAS